MIKHKFKLVIDGVQFINQVDLKVISDLFRNIEMINSSGFEYELIITKRVTSPIDISINEAKVEANQFVDRLSLIENHNIVLLDYIGYVDENNILVLEKKHVVLNVGMTALIKDPTNYYSESTRKNILNSNSNLGLKRAYRTALKVDDPISQYLIFYGLLYILLDESQVKVDDYIKSKITDILIVPGKGKRRDETIITRIRNTIGHPDNNFQLDDLTNKVNGYLETIKKLVLEILRKE